MPKYGIDQDALIQMMSQASAKQTEQLRQGIAQATLAALQGRELTLKNIRNVLKTVADSAASTAAMNKLSPADTERMLDQVVAGMDQAVLKAVEANRVALGQLVKQGADLREKHLKKAISDLDAMGESFVESIRKAAYAAGAQAQAQWAPVLDKLQIKGTLSGAQASTAAQEFMDQMQAAARESRASSLKAVQALSESYAALVSGVLIGMSDAFTAGAPAAKKSSK